jgi:Kelch motif/Galactose oxidase, central domain
VSRRTGVLGLMLSTLVLFLTVAVASGVELPGPPVREWLGISEPPLPDLCQRDPRLVRDPAGEPAPGGWRREPPAPTPSPELGAATVGGFVYLVGGQLREGTESTVLRFDPRSGEYRREPDLPVAIDHPVVAAHDGEVIVAGGYIDGAEATSRVWSYSPRLRRWRELPSMRSARGAAAGGVVGERLYVASGLDEYGNEYEPRRSMEVYDFRRERWLPGPSIPTARHHLAAAALDGRVYFAGGRRPRDLSVDAFEAFDPAENRWRRLPPLPIGSGAPAMAAAGGRLVVTGGGEDTVAGAPGGWVLRAAYAYDPADGGWRRLPDMHEPRHGHSASSVGDRVYVFRGIPCPGYGQMPSVESLGLS